MNDWYYFFIHVDDNLANSAYRVFEEQSKTEIFDWFSREDVAKEQKEDFIQALVEFKDDCGDFYYYRAYLLAAEALNYFKDCSRGDAITLQILKWSYAFFRQDKQDWQIVPQPLVEAARLTVETTDRQRVISAFVHLVHTTQSQHILHIAAEKLGKLAPGIDTPYGLRGGDSSFYETTCSNRISPAKVEVISPEAFMGSSPKVPVCPTVPNPFFNMFSAAFSSRLLTQPH